MEAGAPGELLLAVETLEFDKGLLKVIERKRRDPPLLLRVLMLAERLAETLPRDRYS